MYQAYSGKKMSPERESNPRHSKCRLERSTAEPWENRGERGYTVGLYPMRPTSRIYEL